MMNIIRSLRWEGWNTFQRNSINMNWNFELTYSRIDLRVSKSSAWRMGGGVGGGSKSESDRLSVNFPP